MAEQAVLFPGHQAGDFVGRLQRDEFQFRGFVVLQPVQAQQVGHLLEDQGIGVAGKVHGAHDVQLLYRDLALGPAFQVEGPVVVPGGQ